MGQDKGLPNELDCFGLLAKLRRVCSAGEALVDEGGDLHRRGIQCEDTSLPGKISTKNKMLFQSRVYDRILHNSLTIPSIYIVRFFKLYIFKEMILCNLFELCILKL
jgi:hypothetical protein